MLNLAQSSGTAAQVAEEIRKATNVAAGLSEKGKTLNPKYRSSRSQREAKKTNKVICAPSFLSEDLKSRNPAIKHPNELYGTLNKPIYVHTTKAGIPGVRLVKVKHAQAKGLIKSA